VQWQINGIRNFKQFNRKNKMKQKLELLKNIITDAQLAIIIKKAENRKNEFKFSDEMNIAEIDYELDHLANYKPSEGRK
jgi:hypothetical protein